MDIIYDENKEKKLSKSLKKNTEETLENVKESLGFEQIYDNAVIFNLLKLVEYNGDFYKFESIDSLGTIEIKDANGDTWYISKGRIFYSVQDAINKELR